MIEDEVKIQDEDVTEETLNNAEMNEVQDDGYETPEKKFDEDTDDISVAANSERSKELDDNQEDEGRKSSHHAGRRIRLSADSDNRDAMTIREIGNIDEDLEVQNRQELTPAEKEIASWQDIVNCWRRKSVIRSTVVGVVPDDTKDVVYIMTKYHGIDVKIPDTEFFEPNFEWSQRYSSNECTDEEKARAVRDLDHAISIRKSNEKGFELQKDSPEYNRALKNAQLNVRNRARFNERLSKARYHLGARIMFIIDKRPQRVALDSNYEDWDIPYRYDITASRCKAMEFMRNYKFFNDHRNSGNPLPKEGDIVEANALSVRPEGVRVECLGVETFISAHELSSRLIENCTNEVAPGDHFKVVITRLQIYPEGDAHHPTRIYMAVSRRRYDLKSAVKNILNIKRGGTYIGEVMLYNNEKRNYTCRLDNGVFCSLPASRVASSIPLAVGDKVTVVIGNVYQEYAVASAGFRVNVRR